MELELYLTPRMTRKVKRIAEKMDFNEIWEDMEYYGMTGWYYHLGNMHIEKIMKELEKISVDEVDYIFSLGTGGSYQGVDMILQFSPIKEKFIMIGPSLDADEIQAIFNKIEGKKVGFHIISKSGGTMEILIFINLFKKIIEKAVWVAITTSNIGFVEFIRENFPTVPCIVDFEIPESVGGRFAVASTMGFVCAQMAKVDFEPFMNAFLSHRDLLERGELFSPFERGITRYLLFLDGKVLENLATNEKKISPTLGWAKQLWAESNGKEYKSIFVSVGFYPEDAHSVGQIWKEGPRQVCETFYILKNSKRNFYFENTLALKNLAIKKNDLVEINTDFIESIIEDRFESGIPTVVYRMNDFTMKEWGALVFNEMIGVVIEAYLLGVNPFNQPGVESYKEKVKKRIL